MNITRSTQPQLFLSAAETKQVVTAIKATELKTSAEIRVHLEKKVKGDILQRAQTVFEEIGMTQTEQKNGVMIFLCLTSQQFAVIGDTGIHQKVEANFWEQVVKDMISLFKEDRFGDGLVSAVEKIGKILQINFPYQRNDINELSDQISYS